MDSKSYRSRNVSLFPNFPTTNIEVETGCEDYGKFAHLIESNRPVDEKRALDIAESMKMFGFIGFVVILQTRAYGKKQTYIIDGQHRLLAASMLGLPYNYVVIEFENQKEHDTKDNVVKLMALMNSVSKTWSPMNYLHAYKSLITQDSKKYVAYEDFLDIMQEKGLIATTVLCLLTGEQSFKSCPEFYTGDFKIKKRDWRKALDALSQVRPYLPELARVQTEFISIIREFKAEERIKNYQQVVEHLLGLFKLKYSFPADKVEFKREFNRVLEERFS